MQRRAEQQGRSSADAVGHQARADAAYETEAEHQGEHFGAARNTIAEIAAVGDDVNLWHRHRYAASEPGHAEQTLQSRGRQPDF